MKQKTLLKKIIFIVSLLFSMVPFMIQLNLFHQEKISKKEESSLIKWKGLWISHKENLLLEISEKSNISINNKPLELTLQHILKNELLFQDQYGYSMNITKKVKTLFYYLMKQKKKNILFLELQSKLKNKKGAGK